MARTYGRLQNSDGTMERTANGGYVWIEIDSQSNSNDGYVWLATLCQCLQLVKGESAFFSQYGISSPQAVISQVYPDYDVQVTQQQFQSKFASLTITRSPSGKLEDDGSTSPVYNVFAVLLDGTTVQTTVGI
ncbi:hypothetical protein [Paraburkholderia tropica]|uniref:hypothetical protein n=1 Tax=Paraburkholderia tropica TaxID=92647 RepID=UPI002AB03E8C|nr:hypothetical protein [Paraburkholderia tropica]